MGGSNSGRPGRYPTSEACASYVLDTRMLHRWGLRPGMRGSVGLIYGDDHSVDVTMDTTYTEPRWLELAHESRTHEPQPLRYRVHLLQTEPHFGGLRWWFECPKTYKRVRKLYLPLGGGRFLSRAAYHLGYACQRVTPLERRQRRIAKLTRALGGEGQYGEEIPDKPKWMRWATYDARVAQIERLKAALDHSWAARAAWLVSRL